MTDSTTLSSITTRFFPYSWHHDTTEEEVTLIRVYGLNEHNETICVCISDFTPYMYIELPDTVPWNNSRARIEGLRENLEQLVYGNGAPVKTTLEYKYKLYGVHIQQDGRRKKFPYLKCEFATKSDCDKFRYRIRNGVNVPGVGHVDELKTHEYKADPVLQLICNADIPTSGWIKFVGKQQTGAAKTTRADHEYNVRWRNLKKDESRQDVPKPMIMSFDIEVNSTNPNAMPNPDKPGDKVFQVSCIFSRDTKDKIEKYLLTLGDPNQRKTGDDVVIVRCKTEADLLKEFTRLVCKKAPNVLCGYNILGFDIEYMIKRAEFNRVIKEFCRNGFHKEQVSQQKTIKWSSSAYKNQEFHFIDAEGRLIVDLLPLVQREFKLSNYKLKTVSTHFIGETKDPLSAKGIFKCYRLGMEKVPGEKKKYTPKAQTAMAIVGKYCVQDSVLVLKLMEKLQTWIGLIEMAKTCNVPIFTLYTQGQQIKVFSQVYKYCLDQNIIVEHDVYHVKDTDRYIGAHVFDPIVGQHKRVVPFDFKSLYPTTIIAYNIDYHTWVPDHVKGVPDKACNVMEWEDHQGCEHDKKVIRVNELNVFIENESKEIAKLRARRDGLRGVANKQRREEVVLELNKRMDELKPYREERSELKKTLPKFIMCEKRRFRFLKKPLGVIPSVIQNLLKARDDVRKIDMRGYKSQLKDLTDADEIENVKSILNVLDKRQLSYKVSANSMYGMMGTRQGFLPFMAGAMCTTYMGRKNINLVAKVIPETYGGQLIYGDSDSNYIHFPHLKTAKETWEYAEYVAAEVTKLFNKPIQLEFEEAIYEFFFILSKKRYMYRECDMDGNVADKIGNKGVLLSRRDNSKYIRDVYERVMQMIFKDQSRDEIIYFVIQEINSLFERRRPLTDFIVTKSVGDIGDGEPVMCENDKGQPRVMLGDYMIERLPDDEDDKARALDTKGFSDEMSYYKSLLPAQVQLAEKMRGRGERVDAGSRIEYVVVDPDNHTAKQADKLEDYYYMKKHMDVVNIDHYYYLKALVTPLDQMLNVVFKDEKSSLFKDIVMSQYKLRYKVHRELVKFIKEAGSVKIEFAK